MPLRSLLEQESLPSITSTHIATHLFTGSAAHSSKNYTHRMKVTGPIRREKRKSSLLCASLSNFAALSFSGPIPDEKDTKPVDSDACLMGEMGSCLAHLSPIPSLMVGGQPHGIGYLPSLVLPLLDLY